MNSKPFLKNGMGAEQHTRMYASGSSGHGGPGEREAPMPFFKKVYSLKGKLQIGWMTGFEPATTGTTNRGSTAELHPPFLEQSSTREGFEPPTNCLEGSCSIQLSYRVR